MIKTCETCGEEYKAWNKNQRFCSSLCFGESKWVEYPKHTCKYCGDEFRRANYRSANKFCSVTCANRYRVEQNKYKNGEHYDFKCLICGKEKSAYRTKSEKRRRFCCVSCASIYREEEKRCVKKEKKKM